MQELEYLTDASVITPQQLATFLSQLPEQTILHAPISSPAATPAPIQIPSSPPTQQFANTSLNEKQSNLFNPTPSPALPPPAYASTPAIATASALYEYHPTDAGDLAININDRVFITEFMNADWAKGRNERTGLEGIFPRSYVAIVDDKKAVPPLPTQQPTNYGNVPFDVSQGGSSSSGPQKPESRLNANGKKFGKKMGNAGMSDLKTQPCVSLKKHFSTYTDGLTSNFRCRCHYRLEHREWDFLVRLCFLPVLAEYRSISWLYTRLQLASNDERERVL